MESLEGLQALSKELSCSIWCASCLLLCLPHPKLLLDGVRMVSVGDEQNVSAAWAS